MEGEEFNPWPAFVDILSSVILVLLLFLLVTLVNIGYYSQFKYTVQYSGSVTTEDIILQDTAKKVELDEKKIVEDKAEQIVPKELMEQQIRQQIMKQMKVELQNLKEKVEHQAATDIESAGEDLADKKKSDAKSKQNTSQTSKFFYITYNENELFIDQGVIEKLKTFLAQVKAANANHNINIYATDPLDQISLTVTKQITLGRTLSVRNLLRKLKYEKNQVKIKLSEKIDVPVDVKLDAGVIIIEATNE